MNTATPEAHSFLQFWVIIAFLVMIVAQIVSIIVAIANRKQQREVSFTFTPASKVEFDHHVNETRDNFIQIRAEQKADRHENQVHASARQATLFNELKSTRVELDSKIESTRRELATKIDDMEGRVITTLKNTSAI